MSRPAASKRESLAGSSAPKEALVGVINQPPSPSRTLMFPVDPKVRPRWKIEAPTAQIASRALASALIVRTSTRRRLQSIPAPRKNFDETLIDLTCDRMHRDILSERIVTVRPPSGGQI
jgi:hypothetical protein